MIKIISLAINAIKRINRSTALVTIGFVLLQFGHALQQLLTTVPYSEVAGQRYVEWDSLHTCANVMSMLLLRPHTLASLGRHHQTDEPLSDEFVSNILKGRLIWTCYYVFYTLSFLFCLLYVACIIALCVVCYGQVVNL